MSEKRFRKVMGFIKDNTCKGGDVEGVMDLTEIEDMLNELFEENEQLRQELNDCEKFRHSVFKRMNELTDQLKEKEEDEKQYAEEILKLREINEFNELGGDY